LIGLPIGFFLLVPLLGEIASDRTFGFVMFLPVFILKAIFQISNGQSLGQKLAKIKVAGEISLSATQILIRNVTALLLIAIPVLNAINVLVIIFGKRKQGIHDLLANTRVVKVAS